MGHAVVIAVPEVSAPRLMGAPPLLEDDDFVVRDDDDDDAILMPPRRLLSLLLFAAAAAHRGMLLRRLYIPFAFESPAVWPCLDHHWNAGRSS